MFAFLPVDFWWWLPCIFVTGWIIGYVHFRNALQRDHPDLYEQWSKRRAEKKNRGKDAS